ncbi:ribosomal-protein-alanine N-acetyltransferase [Companilactobacillus tucceti DSM 20183]|uniref:Ribosomal-protein-alanine N-acetyltransferase n=1 Tax=Companilactobacillus tucceti DSM 20183 TaxID=1423811 RepID=A0A0R1IYM7_9LACO|nr:GNAT family N-acetyltransferase [Companilactobacillus tucceti]KRK64230.1 ribosomal-protein-alanine N-acetyltransferase [Companilactobacillus tucceti DSM 20183]
MHLIGRKVIIRDFVDEDFESFYRLVQDEDNHKKAGLEFVLNRDLAKELFKKYQELPNSYAIALENNSMVGIIELNERGMTADLRKTREIGFIVDRDYRRKGIGSEAISLLIEYGFKKLDLIELWAAVETDNLPTKNLLNKLKFKFIYQVNQNSLLTDNKVPLDFYLLKP